MNQKFLQISLLALPVLALLLLMGLHTQNRDSGTVWRVEIGGYDPRDMLRGHYLTYQYEWNLDETAQSACEPGGKCCLCLNESAPGSTLAPQAALMACAAAKAPGACKSYIRGMSYSPGHFHIGSKSGPGLTRYYIPEDYAASLDAMLRNRDEGKPYKFDIALRVGENGRAFIQNLYINDRAFREWLGKGD